MTRTYRLNPCDCLFAAFDHHLKGMGYRGSRMILNLDLEGTLDPARLAKGLERAMEAHPWTMGTLAISRLRAWPYWRCPEAPLGPALLHYDLTREPDWTRKLEGMTEAFFGSGPNDGSPPQVRLAHFQGPANHHRVSMVYPHHLSDVEGAQHFLAEVDRLSSDTPAPKPASLMEDHECADPLVGYGVWQRITMIRKLAAVMPQRSDLSGVALLDSLPGRPVASRRERIIHQIWSPAKVERLRENARKIAPPGPALNSRYVAGCVLRATWRIHQEHGRRLPCYASTFPVHVEGMTRRPVIGNFLVSATVTVGADRIADRRAVAEDIARQYTAFREQRQDLWYWSFLWLAGQLRTWQYRMLVDRAFGSRPFATGYSFYGEIDPPIRQFVGARVTNFWVPALISIPPGWNPLFCRFGDQVNFMIVWPEGSFPEEVVIRYADLIEEEVFEE
jgi:hypothetical protein